MSCSAEINSSRERELYRCVSAWHGGATANKTGNAIDTINQLILQLLCQMATPESDLRLIQY